ncbi:hypothetical protein ACLOJK_000674 [Asimina triloba]
MMPDLEPIKIGDNKASFDCFLPFFRRLNGRKNRRSAAGAFLNADVEIWCTSRQLGALDILLGHPPILVILSHPFTPSSRSRPSAAIPLLHRSRSRSPSSSRSRPSTAIPLLPPSCSRLPSRSRLFAACHSSSSPLTLAITLALDLDLALALALPLSLLYPLLFFFFPFELTLAVAVVVAVAVRLCPPLLYPLQLVSCRRIFPSLPSRTPLLRIFPFKSMAFGDEILSRSTAVGDEIRSRSTVSPSGDDLLSRSTASARGSSPATMLFGNNLQIDVVDYGVCEQICNRFDRLMDLQSYLSRLCLCCTPESKKLFILVDNRPWLIDKDSRSAHLWQLMVTKFVNSIKLSNSCALQSRMSPFANTRARLDRKDIGRRLDLKSRLRFNSNTPKELLKWFSVVDAALYQKKAMLPVKKLRDSLLLNSELRRTLYGFIVFEVSWNDVRGINYLNELQTDTSLALETKLMKRWEFDSIEQASKYMSAWFSGTHNECILLQEYLDNISDSGEVYYDAQDDPSVLDLESDGVYTHNEHGSPKDRSHNAAVRNFELSRADMEYKTSSFHTPPPPSGSYKRRKIMKCASEGGEIDAISKKNNDEVVGSSTHSETSFSTYSVGRKPTEIVFEAATYRDVLILFRFADRDLPFKLRQIIMSDLRLLTLLEYGLPSWSYPAVKWSLTITRGIRSLLSVLTEPIAGPVAELAEFFLPFYQICLKTGETFGSVACIVMGSTWNAVVNVVEMLLWPIWFIHSVVWSIGTYEASMWRALWNDLFSHVRAL